MGRENSYEVRMREMEMRIMMEIEWAGYSGVEIHLLHNDPRSVIARELINFAK